MLTTSIEDFYFAVQAVPGVEAFAILASPSSFPVNGAERLKTIEKARLGDRLGHDALIQRSLAIMPQICGVVAQQQTLFAAEILGGGARS